MNTRAAMLALLLTAMTACDSEIRSSPIQAKEVAAMQDTQKFAAIIINIGNEVKSLSVPDELFASRAFIPVYENPQAFFAPALALMGGGEMNSHQKMIIGYAMQRLPVAQFVALVAATADNVEQHVTDIKVLETTAFAPLNWGKQSFLMYYDDPRVVVILRRLMAMKQLSEKRRAYIRDEVLTGRAKPEYLDYLQMIGHSPQ